MTPTKPTPTPSRPEPVPFPVFLDLAGATVLVVGGGGAAAVAKCRLLGRGGAAVRAVDPEPDDELEALAEAGAVELHRRPWASSDLAGARLCYVALDAAAAAAVRAAGVLVNAVDRPSLCDFATPAIVERGPLAIALGTGGAAPALARDLRARVEAAVPPAFGRLAALCGRWRARVAAAPAWQRQRMRPSALACTRGRGAAGEGAAALLGRAAGRAGRRGRGPCPPRSRARERARRRSRRRADHPPRRPAGCPFM